MNSFRREMRRKNEVWTKPNRRAGPLPVSSHRRSYVPPTGRSRFPDVRHRNGALRTQTDSVTNADENGVVAANSAAGELERSADLSSYGPFWSRYCCNWFLTYNRVGREKHRRVDRDDRTPTN